MHRGRRAKLPKSAAELNLTGTSDTLEIAWLSKRRGEDERVCGGALTMVGFGAMYRGVVVLG